MDFAAIIREMDEAAAEKNYETMAVTRDLKEDYLLAYAVFGDADYLVTGDRDLLVLESIGSLIITRPADFATLLENS